jgi:hypothetical protein
MVFKITGHRLRNNSFILLSLVSILLLILVSPIATNFAESVAFKFARDLKKYKTDYSDGYGELNMDLQVEGYSQCVEICQLRYWYRLKSYFTSGGDVEVIGMKTLNFTIDITGLIIRSDEFVWDPPHENYSTYSVVAFTKHDVISWAGIVEVQYISNGIIQNETLNFDLKIVIPMDEEDLYNLNILGNLVFFSWLLAFPIVPIFLKYLIKPRFMVPSDDESSKKERKYFEFFRKTRKEQD